MVSAACFSVGMPTRSNAFSGSVMRAEAGGGGQGKNGIGAFACGAMPADRAPVFVWLSSVVAGPMAGARVTNQRAAASNGTAIRKAGKRWRRMGQSDPSAAFVALKPGARLLPDDCAKGEALIPRRRPGYVDDAPALLAEGGDRRHFLVAERKIEDVQVLLQPLALRGARDGDDLLLHQPAQAHLRRCFPVGSADFREQPVPRRFAPRDRAIGGDRDAVLAAGGDHLRLV